MVKKTIKIPFGNTDFEAQEPRVIYQNLIEPKLTDDTKDYGLQAALYGARTGRFQCKEPNLTSKPYEGEDLHLKMACKLFNLPPEKITHGMREHAKWINYWNAYGNPKSITQCLKTTRAEVDKIIEEVKKRNE